MESNSQNLPVVPVIGNVIPEALILPN